MYEYTLVPRARGQEGGVGGEVATPHHSFMPVYARNLLSRLHPPHPHRLVTRTRGYVRGVEGEAAAPDIAPVTNQGGCQGHQTQTVNS